MLEAFTLESRHEPHSPRVHGHDTAIAADHPGISALSILAHDLRGPLANLAILLEGIETCSAAPAGDHIAERARRGQNIIHSLDELLRAVLKRTRESGDPLAFRPGRIGIDDVIDEAIALSEPLAAKRGVRIGASSDSGHTVKGDHHLLVQALDNILGNAVKYAPLNSVVSLAVTREAGTVVIRIWDEGRGIPEAQLQRAFRPFNALAARKRSGRASFGLGLWIVRLIAERHGGSVSAAPRAPGHGTVFKVTLPIAP